MICSGCDAERSHTARLYLSMDYVDGEDLATSLRRIGRFPEDKAADIATQLCAGLAAAHQRGVIHRDLKPAHVMLDGAGRVRVMDFGLAAVGHVEDVRAGTPGLHGARAIAGPRGHRAQRHLLPGPGDVRALHRAAGLRRNHGCRPRQPARVTFDTPAIDHRQLWTRPSNARSCGGSILIPIGVPRRLLLIAIAVALASWGLYTSVSGRLWKMEALG